MALDISVLRRSADVYDPNSFANRLRSARFRQFEKLAACLPKPLRILDVGGTSEFWENRGWAGRADCQILSLNLVPEKQRYENIQPFTGDATNLAQFDDGSFDIAFSNSVIEHLFTFEKQIYMAKQIRRIGKAFWVQTPNYWFPIEPHFHIPGWQWMPVDVRIAMLRRWRCGWTGPCPDPAEARRQIEEIRLLTKRELTLLFPGATIIAEHFCGWVKSWTLIDGFPESPVQELPGKGN
jgi:Methyltransferase domain